MLAGQQGRFAEMCALRVQHSRNDNGRKKRFYFAPSATFSCEEWCSEMARPACKGGMSCKRIEFEKDRGQHLEEVEEFEEEDK